MSYKSNRRKALDPELPLSIRASHARSCAVEVCEKYQIPRSTVIEIVLARCGVDLNGPSDASQLERAVTILDTLRVDGILRLL